MNSGAYALRVNEVIGMFASINSDGIASPAESSHSMLFATCARGEVPGSTRPELQRPN
jgi:hypothetical protein